MARVNHVMRAQQRYEMVPKLDADGNQVVTAVTRKNGEAKTTKKGRAIERKVTVEDRTKPLPMPKCGRCGVTIEVGQPYKWVKTKSGPYGGATLIRCKPCPSWKASELSSSKMAGVYAAQEQCDEQIDGCEEVGDLESLRDDLADQIEAVGEEYEEASQNMEDGFGHETSMSSELRERGEELKSWADYIRNVDFDDFEEPEREEDAADDEEHESDVEEARQEWIEEQRSKLSDEMGNCPV